MVRRILLTMALVVIVGCGIPMSKKQVNADLFKNENQFLAFAQILEDAKGKETDVVFKEIERLKLGKRPLSRARFILEQPVVTKQLIFPDASFQPDRVSEYEEYGRFMDRFKTYGLAFRNLRKTLDLLIHQLHMKVDLNGFDHKLFLVEKDGRVENIILALVPIHERDRVYIWEIGQAALDGAMHQGGRVAVKTLGM